MKIAILNNFFGDDKKELETTSEDGRAKAAKIVDELLKSGSAVFLEREVNGETYTYRVTNYDPNTNKLTIRLDSKDIPDGVELAPRKRGRYATRRRGTVDADTGQVVSVAPRSGG